MGEWDPDSKDARYWECDRKMQFGGDLPTNSSLLGCLPCSYFLPCPSLQAHLDLLTVPWVCFDVTVGQQSTEVGGFLREFSTPILIPDCFIVSGEGPTRVPGAGCTYPPTCFSPWRSLKEYKRMFLTS